MLINQADLDMQQAAAPKVSFVFAWKCLRQQMQISETSTPKGKNAGRAVSSSISKDRRRGATRCVFVHKFGT